MAVAGIFVTIELEGALAERIHAQQMAVDPKMARHLPPHVTLIGSSGAGPFHSDTPIDVLQERLLPIAAATPPLTLRFGRAERFVDREIVLLPLDPHGPLRTLHERLRGCGIPYAPARYPFTPHCTLSLYPTLDAATRRALLAVREPEPFEVRALQVYLTREPQPARHLFTAPLGTALADEA
ncbi:MAG: 2'-5' RNA ligase family protein [Gemmatimonadetes bacterium]|nr:2'-5' RNA ligase family protein [Gemmatimonadota bacterium]